MVLAHDLIQKYVENNNVMKSNFTTDFFIPALEYDSYSAMEEDKTSCPDNFTCSLWYFDDHIVDINGLDDMSKRFINYSSLIQTVYRQPINSTDVNIFDIFHDSRTGYFTGLVVHYPNFETDIFANYDCNWRSDTCRYLPCNGYQLPCRYWYSQPLQFAERANKHDVVFLKPYYIEVGDNKSLHRNTCILLHEDEKIIGDTCIAVRLDSKFSEILQDSCRLNGENINYFITDGDGYALLDPKLTKIQIDEHDLVVVSTPDIMYNTSSKEKQEFSEKYYDHLNKIKNGKEQEQEFFFMMDDVEFIMRLKSLRNDRGILKGVIGFYIDYGVIEKKSIIIEQELNDMLHFGFIKGMVVIVIFTVCFSIFNYYGLVYFTFSIDQCAEELRLVKEGAKLKYEAKIFAYSKEITLLNETFSRISIIYVLNNDNNLTDLDTTIQIYEEAYIIFTEIKNYKGIYSVGYHLGMLYMQKSSYKQAIAVFEVCIRIVRRKETDSESLGRVLSCLLQAYYMVENSDSMLNLFRNFEDVLYEKDLKAQLLLECDYIEFTKLPLRSYIQTVKSNINREEDHILLQKYYYYKTLMYSHDRNYAHALKAIEKSLKTGIIFDPQLRKLILKKLQEILSEFAVTWRWVERYIVTLRDQPVDIVILSAICPEQAEFYFKTMRRIYQYQNEEDSITHLICNSERTLLDKDPVKYSMRKFKNSDRSYFYEGFQLAISLMREKQEVRGRSNLWIVILNDKESNISTAAVQNFQTVSQELCISYSVITTRSREAFLNITDKAARTIQYENFKDEYIESMVKFIFSMRYDLNTFISERFLYATYLI